jgi:hypothetical protein
MRRTEMQHRATDPLKMTLLFLLPFLGTLIILIFLAIAFEKKGIDQEQMSELKEVAEAIFNQVMITRLWNAQHGGVYAEVTSDCRPNPYLEIQDRDIKSVAGKEYTMINPSYMTRELSDIATKENNYKMHLVSLQPLNPANSPDEWEREALESFKTEDISEAMSIFYEPDGTRYFKYLAPLKVERPCLKCHEEQGYGYGDIKGGLSITLPMKDSDKIHAIKLKRSLMVLSAIGAISLIFITSITFILSRKLKERIDRRIERDKLQAIVELAGAAAHEMRQPMTNIQNLITISKGKLRDNEPVTEEEMDTVINQCKRMNETIREMLHITRYRTKEYIKGKKILDLDKSSKDE